MCANVTLKLCANDIHFCAQMKTVRKRNFRKMCANVIAPKKYSCSIFDMRLPLTERTEVAGFGVKTSHSDPKLK